MYGEKYKNLLDIFSVFPGLLFSLFTIAWLRIEESQLIRIIGKVVLVAR